MKGGKEARSLCDAVLVVRRSIISFVLFFGEKAFLIEIFRRRFIDQVE